MFLSLPPTFSDSSSSSDGSDAGQSDDSSDESILSLAGVFLVLSLATTIVLIFCAAICDDFI